MWLDGHSNLLQSSRSTFAVHACIPIIHPTGFSFVTSLRRSYRAVWCAHPSLLSVHDEDAASPEDD
ncbi:hypothetical protein [Cutibacterium namnetense]|uniref:hypothetical protein n=1 Tax=Cutibacterium namnetense TaxID=1574624 RepID=UPI0007C78E4A|nr:hypothetical protein [Cutibacterium namnetense]